MKREDIQFTIDQLRKDKIIYAVEAVAVNTACLLAYLVVGFLPFPKGMHRDIALVIGVLGLLYTLYMGISNFRRMQRIRNLEKDLKLKISMYL
jgi:hypothetical protein